jgi:hypothetical protein
MVNTTITTLGHLISAREDGQNYNASVSPRHLEKDTRLHSWVTLFTFLVAEAWTVRIWAIWRHLKLRVSLLTLCCFASRCADVW